MALPAFAAIDDLEARMGSVSDLSRAQAALDDASTLVRAFIGKTWITDEGDLDPDRPDVLLTVTIAVARRAIEGPNAGVRSEALGDATITYDTNATGLFLTDEDRSLLASSFGGFGLTSARVEVPRLAAGVPATTEWWADLEDDEDIA